MASHTATFHQPPGAGSSFGVIGPLVEVDGRGAPWLEVLEIRRYGGVRLNEARFRISEHELGPSSRFGGYDAYREGQWVTVSQVVGQDGAGGNQMLWPLFAGVLSGGGGLVGQKQEHLDVLARDRLAWADRGAVEGYYAVGTGGGVVNIPLGEVVFNPDGRGNRSPGKYWVQSQEIYVFESNPSNAQYWRYADAIGFVAAVFIGTEAISEMTLLGLGGMTEGQILRDVDVTGLSPLGAIDRLCDRAGLGVFSQVWTDRAGRVRTSLQFYRRGWGRRIFLSYQRTGEKLDSLETNLMECEVRSDSPTETFRLIGRGDVKRFEGTFELVKGWDVSLETDDYDLYSPSTKPEFLQVRDVYRKWVLNEAGDYSGAPYNQGSAYDLSRLFGTGRYSLARRRFWRCLSMDNAGKSYGYYLEVSYDNGVSWQEYTGGFDNQLNECGVYLNGNQLDTDLWNAAVAGTLKFRMTASVDSDEYVEAVVADGPLDSARPVRSEMIDLGREFKYRQVTPLSIFYRDTNGQPGPADEVDDHEPMRGLLRDHMRRRRMGRFSGRAKLYWVHPDIWPGDVIEGIGGRELEFARFGGVDETLPQVSEVSLRFGKDWATQMEFGGS